MNRRELLRVLGSAGALPFLGALRPNDLLAAGEALHARAAGAGALSFRYLTAAEGAVVTAMAEAIIPETDTPGATAAGVPQFIDLIFGEWYDEQEREAFRAGLRDIDARSTVAHGNPYMETDEAARHQMLEGLESESVLLRGSNVRPAPFFATMKHLTLWGYYTSEVGAVQELGYETIPGQFNGCVPILPRGTR
ncbi:MAG: gluconate 2-dehydrogenase subunit 3 family protein [Longimicrobiales bacterium]